MKRCGRCLYCIAPVLLVLIFVHLPPLWRLAGEARLPQWDMAKYGVSGLRLASAMARWDLPSLFREINALSVWPPLFPLLEAPAFLVFGRGFAVASRLVLLLWAAALLLLPWALAPLTPRRSPALGWVVAATLAAGPLFQSFATLVMLEVPGLFLMVLALGFTLRALDGEPWAWSAAWLGCAALFFCKYNYGLLFLAPLLLFRARLVFETWTDLLRAALGLARRVAWRSPWVIFFLSASLALLGLHFGGGIQTTLFGLPLRIGSIGNPAFFLLWLMVLRALLGQQRRRESWAALVALDHRHQGVVRFLVAPILVWFLLPPHLKDFLGFVENRSSNLPLLSPESLLFYPRAFLESLAPGPVWGGFILLLAGLGLVPVRGSGGRAFLALWTAMSCAAVLAHPYKQDRFFFHAALALVILSTSVLFTALERLSAAIAGRPFSAFLPGRELLLGLLGLLALAASARVGFRELEVRRDVELRSVPGGVVEVLDAVLERIDAEQGSPSRERTLLLGTWNLASPWLLEWRAFQRASSWLRPSLPLEPRDLLAGKNGEALAARLGRERLRVLFLETLEPRPDYEEETAWLKPVRDELADAARFEAEPERNFPVAGYRLSAWRPR